MFDLKDKLLKIGLVTKEQIKKIEEDKKQHPQKNIPADFKAFDRTRSLNILKSLKKPEQYITIRKWVDINRLDKPGLNDSDYEKFFLPNVNQQISWITIKKDLIEKIKQGHVGVVGYMSNHGYSHAVVPRDIAEDIGQVLPEWVKVLNSIS